MRCNPDRRAAARALVAMVAMVVVVTLLAGAAGAARAAGPVAPAVHAFDANSWAALQRQLPRPAIVVFTTTDCAHCPAVLEQIDHLRRARKPQPLLVTVVMDVSPDEADLLAAPHYRLADRLMAFDGEPVRLRYGVDPRWIGVTPYVALLAVGAQAPRFVMGAPGKADWAVFDAGR
jgi:hypothetical protein